jgi:hypothetical protein
MKTRKVKKAESNEKQHNASRNLRTVAASQDNDSLQDPVTGNQGQEKKEQSMNSKVKALEEKLLPFTKEELLQIRDERLPVTVYVRPLTRTVYLEVNKIRFMEMYHR